MDFTIRTATEADLAAIREIYNYYVERSTCTFQLEPDTVEARSAWFRNRSSAHPVTVAEAADQVIGWASLSPWNPRGAYARTAEASVYIRHDAHRRGVGRALLSDLIERAKLLGHHTIVGGACTEQTASLALQEALGFRSIGVLREVGFKFDRWLDVAYSQYLLGESRS